MAIIAKIEISDDAVIIHTELPGPQAGKTKRELLDEFATDLRDNAFQFASDVLGRILRFNGRMTTEMASLAGVLGGRLGARGVELYDPVTGD